MTFDFSKAAKNLHDLQKVGEAMGLHESVPAATQEQPAGSGAALDRERCEGLYLKFSEALMEPHTPVVIERVNGDCTVSQFIIARDEAHELINQLCEFLRVGSLRKVGEDGAQTFEQWWASIHKFSTDSDRLDHTVLVLSAPFAARREAAELAWQAARSSSVPVGEPKQEEGV